MTDRDRALVERIERLERQNRRMRALGLCALVAAGVVLFSGQDRWLPDPPEELRARSFVLVDEKNRVRAALTNTERGSSLVLRDERGSDRVGLSATTRGAFAAVFGESGNATTALQHSEETPRLVISDDKGVRAQLALTPEGPELNLYDHRRVSRLELDVNQPGPRVALKDGAGNERAALGISQQVSTKGVELQRAESSLVFYKEDGRLIWQAPKVNPKP